MAQMDKPISRLHHVTWPMWPRPAPPAATRVCAALCIVHLLPPVMYAAAGVADCAAHSKPAGESGLTAMLQAVTRTKPIPSQSMSVSVGAVPASAPNTLPSSRTHPCRSRRWQHRSAPNRTCVVTSLASGMISLQTAQPTEADADVISGWVGGVTACQWRHTPLLFE
jgi:hypothetical protein